MTTTTTPYHQQQQQQQEEEAYDSETIDRICRASNTCLVDMTTTHHLKTYMSETNNPIVLKNVFSAACHHQQLELVAFAWECIYEKHKITNAQTWFSEAALDSIRFFRFSLFRRFATLHPQFWTTACLKNFSAFELFLEDADNHDRESLEELGIDSQNRLQILHIMIDNFKTFLVKDDDQWRWFWLVFLYYRTIPSNATRFRLHLPTLQIFHELWKNAIHVLTDDFFILVGSLVCLRNRLDVFDDLIASQLTIREFDVLAFYTNCFNAVCRGRIDFLQKPPSPDIPTICEWFNQLYPPHSFSDEFGVASSEWNDLTVQTLDELDKRITALTRTTTTLETKNHLRQGLLIASANNRIIVVKQYFLPRYLRLDVDINLLHSIMENLARYDLIRMFHLFEERAIQVQPKAWTGMTNTRQAFATMISYDILKIMCFTDAYELLKYVCIGQHPIDRFDVQSKLHCHEEELLLEACQSSSIKCARFLVEVMNADIHINDDLPLFFACRTDHCYSMIEWLMPICHHSISKARTFSILKDAMNNSRTDVLTQLLAKHRLYLDASETELANEIFEYACRERSTTLIFWALCWIGFLRIDLGLLEKYDKFVYEFVYCFRCEAFTCKKTISDFFTLIVLTTAADTDEETKENHCCSIMAQMTASLSKLMCQNAKQTRSVCLEAVCEWIREDLVPFCHTPSAFPTVAIEFQPFCAVSFLWPRLVRAFVLLKHVYSNVLECQTYKNDHVFAKFHHVEDEDLRTMDGSVDASMKESIQFVDVMIGNLITFFVNVIVKHIVVEYYFYIGSAFVNAKLPLPLPITTEANTAEQKNLVISIDFLRVLFQMLLCAKNNILQEERILFEDLDANTIPNKISWESEDSILHTIMVTHMARYNTLKNLGFSSQLVVILPVILALLHSQQDLWTDVLFYQQHDEQQNRPMWMTLCHPGDLGYWPEYWYDKIVWIPLYEMLFPRFSRTAQQQQQQLSPFFDVLDKTPNTSIHALLELILTSMDDVKIRNRKCIELSQAKTAMQCVFELTCSSNITMPEHRFRFSLAKAQQDLRQVFSDVVRTHMQRKTQKILQSSSSSSSSRTLSPLMIHRHFLSCVQSCCENATSLLKMCCRKIHANDNIKGMGEYAETFVARVLDVLEERIKENLSCIRYIPYVIHLLARTNHLSLFSSSYSSSSEEFGKSEFLTLNLVFRCIRQAALRDRLLLNISKDLEYRMLRWFIQHGVSNWEEELVLYLYSLFPCNCTRQMVQFVEQCKAHYCRFMLPCPPPPVGNDQTKSGFLLPNSFRNDTGTNMMMMEPAIIAIAGIVRPRGHVPCNGSPSDVLTIKRRENTAWMTFMVLRPSLLPRHDKLFQKPSNPELVLPRCIVEAYNNYEHCQIIPYMKKTMHVAPTICTVKWMNELSSVTLRRNGKVYHVNVLQAAVCLAFRSSVEQLSLFDLVVRTNIAEVELSKILLHLVKIGICIQTHRHFVMQQQQNSQVSSYTQEEEQEEEKPLKKLPLVQPKFVVPSRQSIMKNRGCPLPPLDNKTKSTPKVKVVAATIQQQQEEKPRIVKVVGRTTSKTPSIMYYQLAFINNTENNTLHHKHHLDDVLLMNDSSATTTTEARKMENSFQDAKVRQTMLDAAILRLLKQKARASTCVIYDGIVVEMARFLTASQMPTMTDMQQRLECLSKQNYCEFDGQENEWLYI